MQGIVSLNVVGSVLYHSWCGGPLVSMEGEGTGDRGLAWWPVGHIFVGFLLFSSVALTGGLVRSVVGPSCRAVGPHVRGVPYVHFMGPTCQAGGEFHS